MKKLVLCGLIMLAFGCAKQHAQRQHAYHQHEPVARPIVDHIPLSKFPEVDVQRKREHLIKKSINLGIIKKVICPKDTPAVYVLDEFTALPFERKQMCIGLVYDYYSYGNINTRIVVIRDRSSGKDIGYYRRPGGGLKMNDLLVPLSGMIETPRL